MLDLVFGEEIFNTLGCKLSFVIYYDSSREFKSANNALLYELFYLLLSERS